MATANPPVWSKVFANENTVIPDFKAAKTMSAVWGNGALAEAASKVFTSGLPTTGFSLKSEWKDLAKALSVDGMNTAALYSLAPDSFSISGLTGVDGVDGVPKPTPAWTFITAPQQISWDVNNQVNRIDMFGTNNPPAVSGTKGMAELTLNDSLVEGFTRGVQVEGKIAALESLLDYGVNRTLGFVDVPVYQVNANDKKYGGPNAYYLIKSVKVTEQLRDLNGHMTRAKVDISLMQVPEFQVDNGRDLASKAAAGAKAPISSQLHQGTNIKANTTGPGAGAPVATPSKKVAGINPEGDKVAPAPGLKIR